MPLFDDIVAKIKEPEEGLFSDIVSKIPQVAQPTTQQVPTGDPGAPTVTAPIYDRDFWPEFGASLEKNTLSVIANLAGSVAHFAKLIDKPGLNWIGKHAGNLSATARWAEIDPANLPSPAKGKAFVAPVSFASL